MFNSNFREYPKISLQFLPLFVSQQWFAQIYVSVCKAGYAHFALFGITAGAFRVQAEFIGKATWGRSDEISPVSLSWGRGKLSNTDREAQQKPFHLVSHNMAVFGRAF